MGVLQFIKIIQMVPNRAKYLNVSFSLSTDQIKTKFTMMVSQQETCCSNEKVER